MEGRSSFYLYLTSNVNYEQFPKNCASAFTNLIRPVIPLTSEYEVSLANIIFPRKIIRIKKEDSNIKIGFTVYYHRPAEKQYHTSYELTYTPQNDIVAQDIYDLIKCLDEDVKRFLRKYNIITKEQEFIFRYRKSDTVVSYKPLIIEPKVNLIPSYSINFSKKLSKLLGYRHGNFVKSPEIIYDIESIFVYSDIVEASSIGSQSVHLLDVLPGDSVYCKNTVLTSYKRVTSRIIESISIKLNDQHGNQILFDDDVTTTIILHFRKLTDNI